MNIFILLTSCAFNATHKLPYIERAPQISSFKNKTVFLRVYEEWGSKDKKEKHDVTSYHKLTEIIKEQGIWKDVYHIPSRNFFQLRQDEIKTYDDFMAKVAPGVKKTDYILEVYFDRKYKMKWHGIFAIISLGLIPTTESYDESIKLKLYDNQNRLIKEVSAFDSYHMWITTLPLPIGRHFSANAAEDFMKANLLFNALVKLKEEIK